MLYGEDIELDIVKLNIEYLSLIQNFKCGNDEIDKFLKQKAIEENEIGKSITRLIFNKDKELIAYYSINCSALIVENYNHRYFSPAIELKMFALNNKYKHIQYSEDDEDYLLSDSLLCIVIKEIINITENICGANNIILYSVPYAINFYERNGFEPFKEYMISSDDMYLNGCLPMLLKL
jgi:hypothetical protein